MINNRFLFFKTRAGFDRELRSGNINRESIAFIQDEKLIWNRGTFYGDNQVLNDKNKGFFKSEQDLKRLYPHPEIGWWAITQGSDHWSLFYCEKSGVWEETTARFDYTGNDAQYATKQELSGVQYTLEQSITSKIYNLNRDLREYFSQNVNRSELNQYIKKSELDLTKFVTTDYLNNYVKSSDLNLEIIEGLIDRKIQNIPTSDNITVDSVLSATSTNPVENRTIKFELDKKIERSDLVNYTTELKVNDIIDDRILEITNSFSDDDDYNIKEDIINKKIKQLQDLIDEINEKYISWGIAESGEGTGGEGESSDGGDYISKRLVTISENAYQALLESGKVDNNTYYFTYNAEDYAEGWTFGDKFPITFTQTWAFGGAFPITLL